MICNQLADGSSLRQICAQKGMPDKATVLRWAVKHPEFRDHYAQAREALMDYWSEEIVEIADDSTNDLMEKEREDGSTYEVVNQENIQRSRLRVDTRKWLMSKLAPKKYGDHQETNVNINVTLADLVNLSFKADLPELPAPKVIEGETE